MRAFVFAYREWAFNIAESILHNPDKPSVSVFTPSEYLELAQDNLPASVSLKAIDPKNMSAIRHLFDKEDVLLFYGWSWMVPASFTDELTCICLHPSPLPKYRGGSPIQNQVMAGEKTGAVTLFKMTRGLDDGPICFQSQISLEGSLEDIFDNIFYAGLVGTEKMLWEMKQGTIRFVEQDSTQATYCKRRKPEESEIIPGDTSQQILNKIRCLQYPYPTAFIAGADGKKVYITGAYCDKEDC